MLAAAVALAAAAGSGAAAGAPPALAPGSLTFVSESAGARSLWVGDPAPETERQLTTAGHGWPSHPRWSASGKLVLFAWTHGSPAAPGLGQRDVYTLDPATRRLRRLTRSAADESWPSWTRAGNVLFLRRSRADGPGEVVVLRPDGSGPRVLARLGPCFGEPELSPDGRTLALASGCRGDTAVWLLDLRSRKLRRIGTVTAPVAAPAAPAWSPDGAELAFVAGDHVLEIVDARGAVRARIAADDTVYSGPRWSRDGTQLLIAQATPALAQGCGVHGERMSNLFAVPADGSGPPVLVRPSCRDEADADWLTPAG